MKSSCKRLAVRLLIGGMPGLGLLSGALSGCAQNQTPDAKDGLSGSESSSSPPSAASAAPEAEASLEMQMVFSGMGAFDSVLSATGTDGTFYVYDSTVTRYTLIKKEADRNSVPNYIFFDDALLRDRDLSR